MDGKMLQKHSHDLVGKLAPFQIIKRLELTEKSTMRWIYNATLRDGQIIEELKSTHEIESISEIIEIGRLH